MESEGKEEEEEEKAAVEPWAARAELLLCSQGRELGQRGEHAIVLALCF